MISVIRLTQLSAHMITIFCVVRTGKNCSLSNAQGVAALLATVARLHVGIQNVFPL